jgi:putative endonuclease
MMGGEGMAGNVMRVISRRASFRAKREIGPLVGCTSMFVYILASKTRRLYVGVTKDLVRRVWEHREDFIPGFTQRYAIKRLVYFETFTGPENAIRREKQIKGYSRVKKLALIDSLNHDWNDLAEHWFADVYPADFSLRSK